MSLIDWIFPPRCLVCRKFLSKSENELCQSCETSWPVWKPPYCHVCARPFSASSTGNHLCGDCLATPKKCKRVVASGIYKGILHDLIIRLKYQSEERLGRFLGERMAKSLDNLLVDLILPVPLHRRKLRERGFNQAVLMARPIARKVRKPIEPLLLIKTQSTPAQAELRGEERRKNLHDVFQILRPKKIRGQRILLIDDVYTTGTTIESITKKLLNAGAKEVTALVAARAV